MVGLDDLGDLFQPERFQDFVINNLGKNFRWREALGFKSRESWKGESNCVFQAGIL